MSMKRFFAVALCVLLTLPCLVSCDSAQNILHDAETKEILRIISDIQAAETKVKNTTALSSLSVRGLADDETREPETPDAEINDFTGLKAALVPNQFMGNLTYWLINYTISDLLYYVADTVGKDAYKYIYEIDYAGSYQVPYSGIDASIYSVDLKGLDKDGNMVGIVESRKDGLYIRTMLLAYHRGNNDYGYETFSYDFTGENPEFWEYNKYDKVDSSFIHMHTHLQQVPVMGGTETVYTGDLIVNGLRLPERLKTQRSILNSVYYGIKQEIYDIICDELLAKKTELFGNSNSSGNGNNYAGSYLGRFRTKNGPVRATYTDANNNELRLVFRNDDKVNPIILADPFYDESLLLQDSRSFDIPVKDYSGLVMPSLNIFVFYPSLNMWRNHNGTDFLTSGETDVFAAECGVIESVQRTFIEGDIITIKHYTKEKFIYTVYKGINMLDFEPGMRVDKNQKIGVTSTKMMTENYGYQLHFEMYSMPLVFNTDSSYYNRTFVNPTDYIADLSEK